MARLLSKIPAGKIKPLRVSQRDKLSQQQYEKRKAKTAANVAQYEKEKAARATTGSRYGYDTMGGNARTLNTNPRTRTFEEFMSIADNVVEAFTLAADKSKPQSPTPTKLPLSRERNIGKHDDWKDKPSTEWGERTPAAKKLASRASAVVGTQRRQDKETGVTNEAVSASDRKLAASGILSKRADALQREIDAVKSGKKPAAPNRSARRIAKQDYQVKEESNVTNEDVADVVVKAADWVRKGPARHAQAVAQHKEKQRQKKIPYAALTAEAKVEAGKSEAEKREIRTARSGLTGSHADYERRGAHREADELNKDAKDIRRGKLNQPQFQGRTGQERIAAVKKAKGIK